jgi:hypothetical protein
MLVARGWRQHVLSIFDDFGILPPASTRRSLEVGLAWDPASRWHGASASKFANPVPVPLPRSRLWTRYLNRL